jgi:GTP cyclohydrolase I
MDLHEHQRWNNATSEEDSFSEQDWRRLLVHLGEDPNRQGLLETPQRVQKAWKHWVSGYSQNPADILKVFEDGAEQYNELIVVRGIPVYSHCEHHLAPFFGTATVGYTPDRRIVGLSKLTRLVDCFARRLQVQERLTIQIAEALMTHVAPLSVGVVIRCRHMCMESRGIQTPGEETVTSALLGEMRTSQGLRSEFLALAKEQK